MNDCRPTNEKNNNAENKMIGARLINLCGLLLVKVVLLFILCGKCSIFLIRELIHPIIILLLMYVVVMWITTSYS